jgi:DnaJ-class molecular chaperone
MGCKYDDDGYGYPDDGEADIYDIDSECTFCGGEGYIMGCDGGVQLWHGANVAYPCPACHGSGLRRDQTIF